MGTFLKSFDILQNERDVTETAAQRTCHGVTLEISQTQGVWFGANNMFRRVATMDTARLSTVLSGRIILVTMTSHFVAG